MVTDLGGQLSWLLAECCGGSGSVCRHGSNRRQGHLSSSVVASGADRLSIMTCAWSSAPLRMVRQCCIAVF